jgi:hypothetical protein
MIILQVFYGLSRIRAKEGIGAKTKQAAKAGRYASKAGVWLILFHPDCHRRLWHLTRSADLLPNGEKRSRASR